MQIIATSGFNVLVLGYSVVQIFTVIRLRGCVEIYATGNSQLSDTCKLFSFSAAACNCPALDSTKWTKEIGLQFQNSLKWFDNVIPYQVAIIIAMTLFTC
ncbi:hypothetical protein HK096_005200, partial [Nowakowskiella sp. JEL0078]